MRPILKTVKLLLTLQDDSLDTYDQPISIEALVAGYLCVHPVCIMDGDEVVETDEWCVSHVASGRSACGSQRFASKQQALCFMRLMQPDSPMWHGSNQYAVAARANNIYRLAVAEMRRTDPDYARDVWLPTRGDRVLVIRRCVKTGERQTHACMVTTVVDGTVDVGGVKFTRSKTGAWVAPRTPLSRFTTTLLPDCSSNRSRFMGGKSNENAAPKRTAPKVCTPAPPPTRAGRGQPGAGCAPRPAPRRSTR